MRNQVRRIRGTIPGIQANARNLRRHSTPAETLLWESLRGRRLAGLRFRRQHPVGRFILDFYCPSCNLVIEVDGGIHTQQVDQDEFRDEHVAQFGYRVLRVRSEEVINDLPGVLDRILAAAIATGHDPNDHDRRPDR